MLVIRAHDVSDAYNQAVREMGRCGQREESRAGAVLVAPHPVMTEYIRPTRRVLLNPHRDANPFFHLFESLWMLAGRNDATFLDRFVGDFSSRFAEPETLRQWGAYGHRWRSHFVLPARDETSLGCDQLDHVVHLLRSNPADRRVVVQMWDAEYDLASEYLTDSGLPARDVPCNTQVYLRVVNGRLDMTVTCRSNDVVWGAYGANVVHFSMLLEYLAGRIGVGVGRYYQFSNNWHLYEATQKKFREWTGDYPGTLPIGSDFDLWDRDLHWFLLEPTKVHQYANLWFVAVARRMWIAHEEYRAGNYAEALDWAEGILAPDWRQACLEWIERRRKKNADRG